MTLTRAILSARVAEKAAGLTVKGAAEAVADTFEIIKAALEGGENVLVSGFGRFNGAGQARAGRTEPEDRQADNHRGAAGGDVQGQRDDEGGDEPMADLKGTWHGQVVDQTTGQGIGKGKLTMGGRVVIPAGSRR